MATCNAGFDGSIRSSFMEKLFARANKYLMSTDTLDSVEINYVGQNNNIVARIVNDLNNEFGYRVGTIKTNDEGLKYVYLEAPKQKIADYKEMYVNLEQARAQGKEDAARLGIEYNDRYLYKINPNQEKPTLEQIKDAKEWFDNSPLRKFVGFQEAFNIVNSNAVAQWTKAGITLFHGADYTDVYHEAWHAFTQLYLTKEQKASLYSEARKVVGQNLSDLEVEEILAEDFRKYVLSGSKNVLNTRPQRNTIFRKIYNLLRKLFSSYSAAQAIDQQMAIDTIAEMYEKLYVGNIQNIIPSIDNIQYNSLNKGLTDLNNDRSLSFEQSAGVVQLIDYMIAEVIDRNNIPITALYEDPAALVYIYNIAKRGLEKTRDAINSMIPNASSDIQRLALQEKVDALNFAIENFGDVAKASKRGSTGTIAHHKKVSKYLEFNIDPKELEEILDLDPADITDWSQIFDRTGTEGELIDYADPVILYMLRSIPSSTTGYFGTPVLYNNTEVFKRVARAITGKKLSMLQMYNILKSSNDPILNKVADKLGRPIFKNNPGRFTIWTKFYQTFNKYEIPIKEFIKDDSGETTKESFGKAVGSTKKIKNDWRRRYNTESNPYRITTSQGTVLNVEKLNKDFPLVSKQNVIQYLEAIGIYVGENPEMTAEVLKLTPRIIDFLKPAITQIYKKDSKSPDFAGIVDPVAALSVTRPDIMIGNKALQSNAKLINELAEIFRTKSDLVISGSVMNAQNKPQNEYSLNNTLTQIIGSLNDQTKTYQEIVAQPHMRSWDINRNPYAKRGIILNSLFDLDPTSERFGQRTGATLEIENFNGVKIVTENDSLGISTANLDPYSKFILDMYAMLSSGSMELPRHASKSSAYAVRVGGQIATGENPMNKHLYVDINKFRDGRGNKAAAKLIKRHLAAELERALIVRQGDINIPGYSENATELTLFSAILNNSRIEAALFSLDVSKDLLAQIEADETLSENIDKAIAGYIVSQTEANLEIFKTQNYKPESLRNVTNVAPNVAVAAFTANQLIHNLEVLTLFYGDPASYNHAVDDFHKRNAGAASTGSIHVTDQAAIEEVNNEEGLLYTKKLAALEGFEIAPIRTVLTVATLQDLIIDLEASDSALYEQYKAAYEKAGLPLNSLEKYKDINTTDGQGYISFDFYKASRQLLGKWTDKQDGLYKKIINGETVSAKDTAEAFPPLKYQYFGPMVTQKLNVFSFHKFSLFPLVPTVIKGTNLERLHNQMVRQGVNYVTYKSGSKLADGAPATAIYDANNNYTEGSLNTYKVHLEYLKDQVNISTKFKGEVNFPTQFRKLVLQHLFDKGKAVSEEAARLAERYESHIEKHIQKKLADLYSSIGINPGSYTLEDKAKFAQYIKERLEKRNLPDHVVEYIDIALNGKVKNNLEASLTSSEIEKALYGIVANSIIKTKVKGEGLVQVSGAGFQKSEIGFSDRLKFYSLENGKVQPMRVKIALQGSFKSLLNLKHADGSRIKTLDRLNEMLKNSEFRSSISPLLRMTGVRIPVQGHNSMEYMEVEEFLPAEAGISIVLPLEITTKSGGDFDIDKMTIVMPNFSIQRSGEINYDLSENTVEGLENNIIQDVADILSLEQNFIHLIRPNDTDIVKPIADLAKANDYNRNFSWTDAPTKIIEMGYNLDKHEVNNIGKITLGIGAVDNTNNALFKRTGLILEPTMKSSPYSKDAVKLGDVGVEIFLKHNKTEQGQIDLGGYYNVNNIPVGDIINQLMNGWVDVEKNAWIFQIQGNEIVSPTLLMLVEAGANFEEAVKFLSNPMLKQYVKNIRTYSSPFNKNYSTDTFKVQEKALEDVIIDNEIEKTIKNPNYVFKTIHPKYLFGELYSELKNQRKSLELSKEELDSLFNGTANKELQAYAFLHFLHLKLVGQFLTGLKLSSNFDTKTFNNLMTLQSKMQKVKKVKARTSETIYPIGAETVDAFFSTPILKTFREASVSQIDAWNFFPVRKHVVDLGFEKMFKQETKEQQERMILNAVSNVLGKLYQENIVGVNPNANEYRSHKIEAAVLESGVVFKDGVFYVDMKQLTKELHNNTFNNQNKNFGRAEVPVAAFSFNVTGGGKSLSEYFGYVLEREYLRSITPITENQTQEQYEEALKHRALTNTNNLWYMFSSSAKANSYASLYSKILEKYPDLASRYSVLRDVVASRAAGIDKLKLSTRTTESEVLNTYHENLRDLANPAVAKVENPAENLNISNFFAKFGSFAFLQNGLARGEFNLTSFAPTENYTQVMEKALESSLETFDQFSAFSMQPGANYSVSVLDYNSELRSEEKAKFKLAVDEAKVVTRNDKETTELLKENKNSKEYSFAFMQKQSKAAWVKNYNNVFDFGSPEELTVEEFGLRAAKIFSQMQYLNTENNEHVTVFPVNMFKEELAKYPEHSAEFAKRFEESFGLELPGYGEVAAREELKQTQPVSDQDVLDAIKTCK